MTTTSRPARYLSRRSSLMAQAASRMDDEGLVGLLKGGASFARGKAYELGTPLFTRFGPDHSFDYRGTTLQNVSHRYNATWSNERALELAIINHVSSAIVPDRSLEIGAVLAHYVEDDKRPAHVVDKYEERDGVLNVDLLEFTPEKRFDLVVSISTLEHFGVDEHDHPNEPERALAGLAYIAESLLSPGGRGFVTIPLGYNTALDSLVAGDVSIEGTTIASAYRRVDRSNRWESVEPSDLRGTVYGRPFRNANGLAVAEVSPTTES